MRSWRAVRACTARAGDRAYFRRVVGGESLVVGDPIVSRSNVGWVIPVARPVKDRRGEMQAVVVVAISLDGFRDWISTDPPSP